MLDAAPVKMSCRSERLISDAATLLLAMTATCA